MAHGVRVCAVICFLIYIYIYICIFFLRRISPELTTANPPLFAEGDWP